MRDFFGCYLLESKHPRGKGHTYIGFTVNPRRRIRQHNGEITSGAAKTKSRRPWEMVLVVYGFPTQVQALQFEWAWQHPEKSLGVRDIAAKLGRKKRYGVAGKVLLLMEMLRGEPWCYYPLTLQFLSSTYSALRGRCPPPPAHMQVLVAPLEALPEVVEDAADPPEEEGGSEDGSDEDGGSSGDDGSQWQDGSLAAGQPPSLAASLLTAAPSARPTSARLAAAASRLGLDGSLMTNLLCCPITQEPLADPVLAADGQTYERGAMEDWIARELAAGRPPCSPLTGVPLAELSLRPNLVVCGMVEAFAAVGLLLQSLTTQGLVRPSMPATDLHQAAANGDAAWLAELLCCAPYLVNEQDAAGSTALLLASYWGCADCVKSLLAAGAEVDLADNRQFTPLYSAAGVKQGGAECVRLLLAAGASTAARDVDGFTPLHRAASFQHVSTAVVQQLLAAAPAMQPAKQPAAPPARPTSARLAAAASGLGLDGSLMTNLLCCPITQEPLADPVLAADGQTYERGAMEGWIAREPAAGRPPCSPLTGALLAELSLRPNLALRGVVEAFAAAGLL
ncbi:Structure-specific endonuclease subunit SLX1 [Chlorella sorokiniana]|uniref:Structure-specific endonuclease subunit SLX1 homolog n=1 Tax=Chlorella sorokiniana TaxID=3076 RepID=A0A2P6TMX7_CHLSO|nr:Structure-specific endonuclease subunit SLX1 [Chlorella sorokiniana]|eukprot:PRW45693.1 Structure-specific endonuclease subunit SLX1 [Chlorella sorokiniana]